MTRIDSLPTASNGYKIPWFVKQDGKTEPDFRLMDPEKWVTAVRYDRCWVCGQKLGSNKVFVVGPMCAISGTTSEPPCHLECAEYSVKECPFLSNPNFERRKQGLENKEAFAGIMVKRNPGVILLYTVKKYFVFREGDGYLIRMGDPVDLKVYKEARPATPDEVMESVSSGCLLPAIKDAVERDGPEAAQYLEKRKIWFFSELAKADQKRSLENAPV